MAFRRSAVRSRSGPPLFPDVKWQMPGLLEPRHLPFVQGLCKVVLAVYGYPHLIPNGVPASVSHHPADLQMGIVL